VTAHAASRINGSGFRGDSEQAVRGVEMLPSDSHSQQLGEVAVQRRAV
jgi:hypothetical protein